VNSLLNLFANKKPVIGMLHLPALPGAPQNKLGLDGILEWVLQDAKTLANGGIDGLMLENFGDIPFYPRRVPPHTVAFMTAIGREIKRDFSLPLGINVLRNDAESAMAIASAIAAEFIRVNVHIGARITDQGIVEGSAHRTLRYRNSIGSSIRIFADADVKHSAPLAARDLTTEVEELATRGCADAIIITGSATGRETSLKDLRTAKTAADGTPVFAGSGVRAENIASVLKIADGVIVGTALKRDGISSNPVEPEATRKFMQSARKI
jgi:membrane complex biogenesis BtpA family protein